MSKSRFCTIVAQYIYPCTSYSFFPLRIKRPWNKRSVHDKCGHFTPVKNRCSISFLFQANVPLQSKQEEEMWEGAREIQLRATTAGENKKEQVQQKKKAGSLQSLSYWIWQRKYEEKKERDPLSEWNSRTYMNIQHRFERRSHHPCLNVCLSICLAF